ncbi:class D beta-lactamase [Methylophaga sp. OBS4]|uniref:class D beta-lactamase n=1 Tax=Methylophaga sp. OBS4 TaxID=2991935 RepID=UPI00225102EE|nr:class D beta-lactamase [Methylophaga sp. OBS4]MCX4188153.1 class D beta-lactamase [Methylophaga sp. OBS4]
MKFFISLILLLISAETFAVEWQDNQQISQLFSEAGINGTFVVFDIKNQRLTGHNRQRAHSRYIPASTFKITNTLIGLAAGSVSNVDEILPYGGQPQPFKAWEQDMSLREAIKISNVPIYQELARCTGLQQMQDSVTRIGYGNNDIGNRVDNFWLRGPLKISAVEQTQMLARLAQKQLPFEKAQQQAVHDIIELEHGENWVLYGKTGWANAPDAGVGWWVGWLQKDKAIYPFAFNMDMQQLEDAPKRIEIGKASLKILGLL